MYVLDDEVQISGLPHVWATLSAVIYLRITGALACPHAWAALPVYVLDDESQIGPAPRMGDAPGGDFSENHRVADRACPTYGRRSRR